MIPFKRFGPGLGVLIVLLMSVAAAPARADDTPRGWADALEAEIDALGEAVGEAARALEGLIENLPRYGFPEVQDNGDILIPRKGPGSSAAPEGEQAIETADVRSL